jgi:hypothetical protein
MIQDTLEVFEAKVFEAYSRFKAYVYYDNFNLTLRAELAKYENDEILNGKLTKLAIELYQFLNEGELSSRILKMIKNSGYIVLPKSFRNASGSQRKNSILISNQLNEDFFVEKNTILFDGEIELQIIATLWIMEEGVKLNKQIGHDSYGYHLPMHNEETRLGTQKLLFTKYFEKYQEWRDKGIRAAKSQIEEGNDILLISLDIKNFFHSTQIDFNELRKDLKCEGQSSLTSIIEIICIEHTKKLKIKPSERRSKLPLLPIGLVASGVIANWLLSDFDKELKDKMAPVYYGRYVDDIFIVVSNVKPPKETIIDDPEKTNITEQTIRWMADRFFKGGTPLKVNNDGLSLNLTEKKYDGLTIQADKLKLYYFSPDWPHAMLNKFQKALEENSSAFWFLPDEEDLKDSLDDEAYDMQYEDTINKFRSISDVKASKYGASVFLAKRIKLAILHSGSPDEKITKEVFRFFKGVSVLALYNMWEKVFSYLVVTTDLKAIRKLHKQILKAINELNANEKTDELKVTLNNHLNVCLEMAFSLHPALLDNLFKNDESFAVKQAEIEIGITNLRFGILTRHHYLPLPSLVISDYYLNTKESLLSEGLFERLLDIDSSFNLNAKLITESWRVPRWYYMQEVCMFYFLMDLKQWKKDNNKVFFYNTNKGPDGKLIYTDSYVTECCKLFEDLNKRKISNIITTELLKRYREGLSNELKIDSWVTSIHDGENGLKLKLGLSNMRIEGKDLRAAIYKKSIISKEKRTKHIKILNLAEEERVDLLILPEVSVPFEWLYAYADEARRKQRAFIFGLEHFTISNFCFNFSIGLLPLEIGKMKEVFILPRLKNHYSPNEENEIRKIGKFVPKPTTSFYHLIKWKNIQFSIYNCYELTDVVHRSIFRSELDILFAIEYNKDTNYFSNIAESTCRDLHCYFVQANTSEYGDSRVVEPKETEKMNPVRVKGGENNVILRYELDIQKLRDFQIQRLPYQMEDKTFKTTPPDFNHEKVEKRGK